MVDIHQLLSLPEKQRRKIAEKLWDSLEPGIRDEQQVQKLLQKRWKEIQEGKSKPVPSDQFWKNMEAHLLSKSR